MPPHTCIMEGLTRCDRVQHDDVNQGVSAVTGCLLAPCGTSRTTETTTNLLRPVRLRRKARISDVVRTKSVSTIIPNAAEMSHYQSEYRVNRRH